MAGVKITFLQHEDAGLVRIYLTIILSLRKVPERINSISTPNISSTLGNLCIRHACPHCSIEHAIETIDIVHSPHVSFCFCHGILRDWEKGTLVAVTPSANTHKCQAHRAEDLAPRA